MTLLETIAVSKSFRGRPNGIPVLDEVSFTLRAGDVAWLSSPSGGGKSTLINILGLLAPPDAGRYLLDGKELIGLPARSRTSLRASTFSTIFQSGNLFGHLTALENVRLGLPSDAARQARAALLRTSMDRSADQRAGTLSGGEQQRVAIARALAGNSRVILADEPTASLDDENATVVLGLLALAAKSGAVVLVASHDSRVASIAHQRFDLREGRIS